MPADRITRTSARALAGPLAGLLLTAGALIVPAAATPAFAGDEAATTVGAIGSAGGTPAPDDDPTYLFGEGSFDDSIEVRDELPWIPSSNTVAAKLPLPLRDTPASVAVVPRPLLSERGATVLGDALENVSGLNVHTGSGIFDFFVVRGLDSVSSGLILSDGAPELETTFYQLYNVERAEVFKGPTAFLYGGGPLGGTVNLVRKQPAPGRFGSVTLGGGSFGTWEGTLDANLAGGDGAPGASRGAGDVSFRVNALWRQSDGFRDGRDSEMAAFNPALTWRPRDNQSLNLWAERVDFDASPDSGLPLAPGAFGAATVLPEVPRERSYQAPLDRSEQTIDRVQLDWEAILGSRLSVRAKGYYRSMDWRSDTTTLNGVIIPTAGPFPVPLDLADAEVARTLLLLDDSQELFGGQVEAVASLGSGAVTHELLVGLEVSRYTDRFDFDVALLPTIGLLSPVETAPGSPDLLPRLPGQAAGADAENVVVAPYVVDQIRIGDRFSVLAGARLDSSDFDDERAGTSRDDDELSPMLGAVWAPSDRVSVYGNWGEAFAPPSTFTPAEDRVPEESEQAEVGVKMGLFEGRAEASLAVFRIERTGVAIPDDTGVLRQVGDQRSEGVELELRGMAGGEGWLEGTRYTLAYAYTDSTLTEYRELTQLPFPPFVIIDDYSGATAPFTPDHMLSLWLSKPLAGGFTAALGGRWVDDQFIDEDNAFAIDSHARLDAAVTWRRDRWRLHLDLDNLTDEEYFTRGFGGSSVIPAPGRSATARVEIGLR